MPTDAAVWAFWNNPALAAAPLPPSQTDGSVWDATHLAVYHMQDTNAVAQGTNTVTATPDATSAGRHAVRLESVLQPQYPLATPGLIGGAHEFAGIVGQETPVTNLHNFTYAFAGETRITNYTVILWAKSSTNVQDRYASTFNNNASVNDFQFGTALGGTTLEYAGQTALPFATSIPSNWYQQAITCDGLAPITRLYFNGAQVNTGAFEDGTFGQFQIGCNRAPDHTYMGWIDEVRVMNSVASPDWIAASYQNVASNATFLAPSSEGTVIILSNHGMPVPGGTNSYVYDTVLTNTIDATIGALAGSGNLNLGSQELSTGGNGADTTYSGRIRGAGDPILSHDGAGTLTLTGTSAVGIK